MAHIILGRPNIKGPQNIGPLIIVRHTLASRPNIGWGPIIGAPPIVGTTNIGATK